MAATFSARVAAVPAALSGLTNELEAFLAAADLPDGAAHNLLLAFDELATNVVHHAYDHADGLMEVSVVIDADEASMTVLDGGRAFDPTRLAPADTAAALDDRPIGGLGVLLVRRLMDSFDYARDGDANWVKIALSLRR